MKQRILSLLMAGAMIFTMPYMGSFGTVIAYADEEAEEESEDEELPESELEVVELSSAEDIYELAENSRTQDYSYNKIFYLTQDIELSIENTSIPFMDGIFDGKGHTISGIKLCEEITDYGFFRFIGSNGVIRNVTLSGEVVAGEDQQHIGLLSGTNEGKIENCTVKGSVDGQAQTGGIAGYNEKMGQILGCTNEAAVNGKYQTGGVVGANLGQIRDSKNKGLINGNAKVTKSMIDSDSSAVNISIPNAVTGLAADDRANETGGIAGYSEGKIAGCSNNATIGYEHLGSVTGGIVGHSYGKVTDCDNTGVIYGHKKIGGIVGYLEPYEAFEYDVDYVEQFKDQLDELSDIIDDLADAGDDLGDDFSNNAELLSEEVKNLRASLQSYGDGFEADIDSARSNIRVQTNDIRDIVDDMDYDFQTRRALKYAGQIKDDVERMVELIKELDKLADSLSGDPQTVAAILKALEQYKKQAGAWLDWYNKVIGLIGSGKKSSSKDKSKGDAKKDDVELIDDGDDWSDPDERVIVEPGDDFDKDKPSDDKPNEDVPDKPSEEEPAEEPKEEPKEEPAEEPKEEPKEETPSESKDTPSDNTEEAKCTIIIKEAPAFAAENRIVVSASSNGINMDALKKALLIVEELGDLESDIKEKASAIEDILEDNVDNIDDIKSDLKDIRDNSNEIYNLSNDLIDKIDGRADVMKADVRGQGDAISNTVDATRDQLEADWDKFNDNIDRLTDKAHDLRVTVSDGYDEIRNRIEDKSIYVDISEMADINGGNNGRVLSCKNDGEIYADSIAGGIVGAIDKEDKSEETLDALNKFIGYTMDADEEEDEDENDSDDFDSITKHVEAVVYECKNNADILIDTDYAGGVVGKAPYGYIKDCSDFGDVASDDGKYIGGIAGLSKLTVDGSYMFGGLTGKAYVGGVVGKGNDVGNSYVCSYMDMGNDFSKDAGAIAGKATGTAYNNYFVDNGYGAIDGITKTGEASGMTYEQMLSIADMPKEFKSFTIRFIDEDDVVWSKDFKYGDEFLATDYPELIGDDGEYAYWEDKVLSPVCRNVTVHSVRRVFVPSIQAKSADNDKSKPDMLLGGEFFPDSVLSVERVDNDKNSEINKVLQDIVHDLHYIIMRGYHYQLTQSEPFSGVVTLRVLDDGLVTANRVMILDEDLNIVNEIVEAEAVESFLSLETNIPSSGYVVLIEKVSRVTVALLVVLALILLVLLVIILIFARRKRKKLQAKIKQALEDTNKPLEEVLEAEKENTNTDESK